MMRCTCCKTGNMEESRTTYFAQLENCYVIIENVPCKKCTQCGEEYLNGVTLKKIERIISQVKKLLTEVAIIDYTKAA